MTIHLPGRSAAPAEIAPDLARAIAERAEAKLRDHNKQALFDGLRLVDIAYVTVGFEGWGSSWEIESIDARNDADHSVTLPEAHVTFAGTDWQTKESLDRSLTLEAAVEKLVYTFLTDSHGVWENDAGVYGEFCIDARARTMHLAFNERFASSERDTQDSEAVVRRPPEAEVGGRSVTG